jgi:hypothetical protein
LILLFFFLVGAGYDSIIPDAPNAESHPLTNALAEKTNKWVEQYLEAMEKVSFCTVSSIALFHCTTYYDLQPKMFTPFATG